MQEIINRLLMSQRLHNQNAEMRLAELKNVYEKEIKRLQSLCNQLTVSFTAVLNVFHLYPFLTTRQLILIGTI